MPKSGVFSADLAGLQRANEALTKDLEECLDILCDARAFTDEVEKVLLTIPTFVEFMKRQLQGLMLLQHGVFLESAAAMFCAWHEDRESLIGAFSREARDACEDYQRNVENLVERHEAEVEELRIDWRREQESMRAEMAALTQQFELSRESEAMENKVKDALLKRAAALIEQRGRRSCDKSSRASLAVVATACQTENVCCRSAASQTPGRLSRAAESANSSQCGVVKQERTNDTVVTDAFRREVPRLQSGRVQERTAAMGACPECSLLEERLQEQSREIAFLRSALERVEMGVFSPSEVTVQSLKKPTPLQQLAAAGGAAFCSLAGEEMGALCATGR